MFQETSPEIWFCTFWWYPLKPEVKFWKQSLPEVITGNWNLNSFSSDFWYVQSPSVQTIPNHVSLSQNQNPWFYRTNWNCGGGELFGSVTVKVPELPKNTGYVDLNYLCVYLRFSRPILFCVFTKNDINR